MNKPVDRLSKPLISASWHCVHLQLWSIFIGSWMQFVWLGIGEGLVISGIAIAIIYRIRGARYWSVLFLLCLCLFAGCQQPETVPASVSHDLTVTVVPKGGRFVDSADGAKVEMWTPWHEELLDAGGQVDASGKYVFHNVKRWPVVVYATKDGFIGGASGLDLPAKELTVPIYDKDAGQTYIIKPDGTQVKWSEEEEAKIPPCGPDTPAHTTCKPQPNQVLPGPGDDEPTPAKPCPKK